MTETTELKKAKLIIKLVNDYFKSNCQKDERYKFTVIPRQIAQYLIRENTSLILMDIGELFNRGHETVLYSVNKIRDILPFDKQINKFVEDLKKDAQIIGEFGDVSLEEYNKREDIFNSLINLNLAQLNGISTYINHYYKNDTQTLPNKFN